MHKASTNSASSHNVSDALTAARLRLAPHSDSAALDAQVLLAHILREGRAWLLAHPEFGLSQRQQEDFDKAISEIEAGKALPYILGSWEFYGLEFELSPDVLIPRPETELLVDHALAFLKEREKIQHCADVGTGSGCVAIAIAKHAAHARFKALDISEKALKIASKNVGKHGLNEQIDLQRSDLLEGATGPFDLICANLPYIPSERLTHLSVYKKEPRLALDGGQDGLLYIKPFLEQAADKMKPSACLLAEIDESHPEQVQEIAKALFSNSSIDIIEDLAGRPRLLKIAA